MRVFLSLLILFGLLTMSSCTHSASEIYPGTAVVIHLDHDENLVTVMTATEITYQFNGINDLMEGDLVSMIMDSNHTPDNVLDDIVIEASFSGYYM